MTAARSARTRTRPLSEQIADSAQGGRGFREKRRVSVALIRGDRRHVPGSYAGGSLQLRMDGQLLVGRITFGHVLVGRDGARLELGERRLHGKYATNLVFSKQKGENL